MTRSEALDRLNTLRSCIVKTQSATWSNSVYPLVAILNGAGFEPFEPTAEQLAAHLRAYGGAGGMPEPERECTCVGGSWCAMHGDVVDGQAVSKRD